ncbi:hypothetical protein DNH61_24870 [Paenibacillus sambharensis]|uniref:Uncharacterized protein n=1 Tax=Paenibacillus sambharensis TaxID=1803190 RepID=A0A2W1L1U5_9BACL|nr:hypothetical protein [Paenibacillus sambharensis]PZD93023.1 hypothetical protein DNH61_24870 [Paenibacillus sambharensis]
MKINAFIEEYDLHDSLIKKNQINGGKLVLEIALCNWRQNNYSPNENEMKEIKVVFGNVQSYYLDSTNDTVDSDSIMEINCSDVDSSPTLKDIKIVFEGEEGIKIMTFRSDSVTVEHDSLC